MAVLAFRDVGVTCRSRLGMNAMVVGLLLVGVAADAYWLCGRGIVGERLDVFVTIGATEDAVYRGLELRVIHMQAELFAVLLFAESGIVMASQTVLVAHLGRGLGHRPRAEQQGNKENHTATLHRSPHFRRTRPLGRVTHYHRR